MLVEIDINEYDYKYKVKENYKHWKVLIGLY